MAAWIPYYMLTVGILITGLWVSLLVRGRVPEVKSTPAGIAFHIAAELVCAGTLITAAVMSLAQAATSTTWAALAMGMLVYTVINSAGHYAQAKLWPPVAMFGILLVGTVVALVALIT